MPEEFELHHIYGISTFDTTADNQSTNGGEQMEPYIVDGPAEQATEDSRFEFYK